MTREEFRAWVVNARDLLNTREGQGRHSPVLLAWAAEVRPHDSKLADLYTKQANVHAEIAAHLLEDR
jgi:hypothetical protein